MNLLKSPLRRTVAAVAGAFIGLTGAFALTTPASAHWGELDVATQCADNGGWQVKWTINTHQTGGLSATIADLSTIEGGSTLTTIANGINKIAPEQSISEVQTFSNKVGEAHFHAKVYWGTPGTQNYWESVLDRTVTKIAGCKETPETPPGDTDNPPADTPTKPEKPATPAATPGEPTPIVEFDCDTMTVGLDNPKNGIKITLLLETSKGEKRTLTVKPGEKKTTKFSAKPGFTVTVGAKEVKETTTIAYTKPDDCAAAGSGGGDVLALTGANASTIAGVAGGVLLIGAALFFMARRRKIKFTA
ncbi:LPXTG cell wall anchor domain-containing protein [Actinoplanes sp. NPDC049265]|uniref:LPXTG cell wall anchor domain-containing protein n=1 Tax=Actinoplanes sp. NPDC049265 TaxID=3363902 RepID=UPI003714697E